MAMAYSSSSLSEQDTSSSFETFLALSDSESNFSFVTLEISESFPSTTSYTFRLLAQENGVALDAERLLFLAGGPDNAFDDDVQDHDQYLDDTYAYNEEHVMHDSVQLDHVVDLHADHTSISNMIPYDQEQVELYERRAKFELTEREQKINKQLRLVISDRNFKEETLKRELHSIKLQLLTSTINRNKSMVEETTRLKQDFKQKENKLLVDFLNMKSLMEKVEDRLLKTYDGGSLTALEFREEVHRDSSIRK
nr:hypothetical protein [Tanacetum cinerariifolium]